MKRTLITLVTGLLFLSTVDINASGSYTGRPPRPPRKDKNHESQAGTERHGGKLDSAKYDLGKRVYSGKATLSARSDERATQQEPKLRAWNDALPASAQKSKLTSYAGRLTNEQMEALEYYLHERFDLH